MTPIIRQLMIIAVNFLLDNIELIKFGGPPFHDGEQDKQSARRALEKLDTLIQDTPDPVSTGN